MADSSARLSTMEKRRFRITTPPQFDTSLYSQNTCEGHAGCLATLASSYLERWLLRN
jgi:hypothetical protein